MRLTAIAFMLVIVPTSLLLGGCADNVEDVISQASKIQADVTTKINDVKQGVDNMITEVENARDTLIEKKRQLEQAVTDIQDAMASIDKLLGKVSNEQVSGIITEEVAPAEETLPDTTVVATEKAELEAKKAELEAALAELNTALSEADKTLEAETTPAE